MGVRGLTSYIAQRAEHYLVPYELHDCTLVIDGDNIACNLYRDVTGTYSAFGGDYDDYYRAVVAFFHVLAECNVRPYVLMDGGYEERKLRTVAQRLRVKINVIKRINPCGSVTIFPLLMKEVFVDAVRDCGVPIMRCIFEADEELAALSRKLHCPVLSYDSDFYIHNVRYIPLVTLTLKAHTKRLKENSNGIENAKPKRKLRKNEAKHVEKLSKSNRIMSAIEVNTPQALNSKNERTFKYLDCCIYRIEHLVTRRSLSKEKLPLFAALLGNDYITRSSFRNFFEINLSRGGPKRKIKQQQKRIKRILLWLKEESLESALRKILGRLKKNQRESLLEQVQGAISGYSNEKCYSYDYFKVNYSDAFNEFVDFASDRNEEEEEHEDILEQSPESESGESDEESIGDIEEEKVDSEHKNEEVGAEISENHDESENSDNDTNEEEKIEESIENEHDDKNKTLPDWFLEKLYSGSIPRFLVDLLHLKKYINSPQIEHFAYHDCNEIALPILRYTFTLLHSVEDENTVQAIDNVLDKAEFTYLTRATRVTNVQYIRYSADKPPELPFNPRNPNPLLFRKIFKEGKREFDADRLFTKVNLLPLDLRLYFIAIVYWLQYSQHCDLTHLHSLIISLVVLRTIDTKIPPERDLNVFQKRFGKIIRKEQLVREKEALLGIKRTIKKDLCSLPVPERMQFIPKSDCYLVQDKLLKYFHMPELFKKKYDLYSSQVLHAFAEFQCVVFQLHALNGLLNSYYESPHMGQLYCGAFIYNLYDLLRVRPDIRYYVENFIFRDSLMMFDLYCYLVDWCDEFIPQYKRKKTEDTEKSVSKKTLKKQRQAARKKASIGLVTVVDPYKECISDDAEVNDFMDMNNKFCAFLKIV